MDFECFGDVMKGDNREYLAKTSKKMNEHSVVWGPS